VRPRHIVGSIGTAAVATWAIPIASIPTAQAAPCPDAEVVFARGTTEAPGLGPTGDAFVDSLRARVGAKSVGVYPVDYPATTDFPTAVVGITDARTHVLATAANCPHTKMVLGGFSQGAAVTGFVTANVVPDGVSALDVPAPMPPEIASHVAAVALFGKPSTRFMHAINDPPITVGQQYVAKTIDLCVDNDLVCDPKGSSFSAHNQYVEAGMVDQGAAFVANQLQASWAADGPVPTAPPAGAPTPSPLAASAPLTPPAPAAPVAAPAPSAGPSPHLPSAPVTPPGPTTPIAPPPPVGPLA
jgi:cutinase